jgi:hypothetical protein
MELIGDLSIGPITIPYYAHPGVVILNHGDPTRRTFTCPEELAAVVNGLIKENESCKT